MWRRNKPASVALLLFLAAGCGSTGIPVNSPSSPLGSGGDSFRQCVPDLSGTTMTDGITVLEKPQQRHDDSQFAQAVVVPIHRDAIAARLQAGTPKWNPDAWPGATWMDTYDKPEYQLTEDDRSWAAELADAAPDFTRDQRGAIAAEARRRQAQDRRYR
jgi:hypothetical protein